MTYRRARATSAAPSYFKAFRSKRNRRGYLDGALYHNNPIRVADLERRLIWPDTESSPPDILLSIGTSCNNSIPRGADDRMHFPPRANDATPSRSGVEKKKHERFKGSRWKTTQMSKIINIMKHRVENILDTEMTWLMFMSDAARGDEDTKKRYRRINPSIGKDPPKLDDVKMLPSLRLTIQNALKYGDLRKSIGEVARQLVASSFYVEVPYPPIHSHEFETLVSGTGSSLSQWYGLIYVARIRCRFPSGSLEIRRLGDYLRNATSQHFHPFFDIGEKDSNSEPLKVFIKQPLIEGMLMKALFGIDEVQIPVSSELAVTTIALSLVDGEMLPISGFPRVLLTTGVPRSNLARHAHSRQITLTGLFGSVICIL